jgi:hypothetical protein
MTPLIARPPSHPPPGDAPPSRRPIINLGSGSTSLNHQLEAELFRRQQTRDRARHRYFEHPRCCALRGAYTNAMAFSCRPLVVYFFHRYPKEEMMDTLAFSELAAPDVSTYNAHCLVYPPVTHLPLASHTTLSHSHLLSASSMWTKSPAPVAK